MVYKKLGLMILIFQKKGNATHTYDLHNQYLSKVLFEVVSETDASECLFITEKLINHFYLSLFYTSRQSFYIKVQEI